MPKRNTYHSREDFFWAEQKENETPEEHWEKLITLEKNCEFKDIKQEVLLISKLITSKTDKKLRENLSVKDPLHKNHHRTHHTKQLRPPTPTIYYTTRTRTDKEIKEEPIQKIKTNNKTDKYGNTTQKKNNCGFCGQQKWSPQHICPQKLGNAITARNWAPLHDYAAANKTKVTKEESTT